MSSVRELVSKWVQRIINDDFDDSSVDYLYDDYDKIISNMDCSELIVFIRKSLKFYITHRLDFRDNDYAVKISKFVDDIISIANDCGRSNYVLEIPMIALYIRLKLNSDDISETQHIYNSILNFLSEYRENVSNDRCLLQIWHRLSELGYIQKSDSSHYVRLLKHNVYSTAFNILGKRSWNNSAVDKGDYNISTVTARKNSTESLRYRLGIRVRSILDINKNDNYDNITVYGLLNFIHCTNIGACDSDMNCPAIGDNLSTDNNYTAIAAMLSTDRDYAAIEVIRSTYNLYYDLLLNILNDMDFDYWSVTYEKLESLLVTSINILCKTKSYDMYLICILILEIMKRVSNYGDTDNICRYNKRIHESCCDDIIYTNNPAELRLVFNTIESEINKLSYVKRAGTNMSHSNSEKSFIESCGVELSHLDNVAGFLTEGFQVIPHEIPDRNLAVTESNNGLIYANIMSIKESDVYQECQQLDSIAQVARDNEDEQSILNNISFTNSIIRELSKRKQTGQIIKAIDVLRHSVSMDRLTIAKMNKTNPRKRTDGSGSYNCSLNNSEIIVQI